MWEGTAQVLEDAVAEAADEHLNSVVRDRTGQKYAPGGFGNKDWRWIVFTPERVFNWDNGKLPKRPPKPAAT